MTMQQLGIIGLGTMGANLARNAARQGITVVLYNRTEQKTRAHMEQFGSEGTFIPTFSYEEFVAALAPPRAVLLMVKAGDAVDGVLQDILPLLSAGDMVIDAGNSHYRDTERRVAGLAEAGVRFVGMGVSGGEEGALHGPSMMPGGDKHACDLLMPMFQSMAASDTAGGRCVQYMGPGGAGHFVKTVHNGIEYGVMQLLAEAYHLLSSACGLSLPQMADLFREWNEDERLRSYLMEITAEILRAKDPQTGSALLDLIVDAAAQKGTGKWTTDAAMQYGVAVPTITAGVDARIVSSAKEWRVANAGNGIRLATTDVPELAPSDIRDALAVAVMQTYAQGFQLLAIASDTESWQLPLSDIARIWRGGCIIRAASLVQWQASMQGDEQAKLALRAQFDSGAQVCLRKVVAYGALKGVPLPALSASLWYADAYRTARLPQNLIQAQRDFFGAHTYKRTDADGVFHTDWQQISNPSLSD